MNKKGSGTNCRGFPPASAVLHPASETQQSNASSSLRPRQARPQKPLLFLLRPNRRLVSSPLLPSPKPRVTSSHLRSLILSSSSPPAWLPRSLIAILISSSLVSVLPGTLVLPPFKRFDLRYHRDLSIAIHCICTTPLHAFRLCRLGSVLDGVLVARGACPLRRPGDCRFFAGFISLCRQGARTMSEMVQMEMDCRTGLIDAGVIF